MRRIVLAALVAAALLFVMPRFARADTVPAPTSLNSPSTKLLEPSTNMFTQPNGRMDGNLFLWPTRHLMLGFKARSLGDIGPHFGLGARDPVPGIRSITGTYWLPVNLRGGSLFTPETGLVGFIVSF